jgi:hypothetical protein
MIALNVNMVLIIEHNCEKNVLNFRLISWDKNYSNFFFFYLMSRNYKIPFKKSLTKKRFLIILPTTCQNDP